MNFKCTERLQNGIKPLSTKDPYRKVNGYGCYGTFRKKHDNFVKYLVPITAICLIADWIEQFKPKM